MAQAAKKATEEAYNLTLDRAATRSPVQVVTEDMPAAAKASPAIMLQQRVAHAYEVANDARRWSPRRTLAFIGLVCGGFWAAVAVAAVALTH